MTLPLVSACMGAYNRADFIGAAIDSVLAQSYANLEVVVVENVSTDDTARVLEGYGDRIRLIRRTTHATACAVSRNQAAQAARGRYIAFIDSDDIWYPDKIQRQVAYMEAHPEAALCHTYCRVINDQSEPLGVRHQGSIPPTGAYFRALLDHCWITISSAMVRRDIFEEVGWFNETGLFAHCGDDYEFFLRVAARHPIAFLDEILAGYRRGVQNITYGRWRQSPEAVPFHRYLVDHPELWRGSAPRSKVVQSHLRACLENAIYWRGQGYPTRALWFMGQALRYRWWSPALWSETLKSGVRAVTRGKSGFATGR